MKKVILSFLLLLALVITLVSCGETPDNTPDDTTKSSETTTKAEETTKQADEPSQEKEIEFTETVEPVELTACATSSASELYEANEEDIPEASKENIKAIYDNILCAMNSVEGTPEEMKEQLNALYQQLDSAIELAKSAENYKELAEKELTALYESAKAMAGEATAVLTALETSYQTALTSIKELADRDALESEFQGILAGFRSGIEEATRQVVADQLTALKTKVIASIDEQANALLAQMGESENELVKAISTYVTNAKQQVQQCSDMESLSTLAKDTLEGYKQFAQEKVLAYATQLKTTALATLDKAKDELLAIIPESATDIKTQIDTFYATEKAKIDAIDSIETGKQVAGEIATDCTTFASQILASSIDLLKQYATTQVTTAVNSALALIKDEDLKTELSTFLDTEKGKISAITDAETAKTVTDEIIQETKDKAVEICGKELTKLKENLLKETDTLVNNVLAKIENQTIKDEISTYYNTLKTSVNNISSLETASTELATLKTDLASHIAEQTKALVDEAIRQAITQLDTVVNTAIAKISDEALQQELSNFYNNEKTKLQAVTSLNDVEATIQEVTQDITTEIATLSASQLVKLKDDAISQLNTLVNEALAKLEDSEAKTKLQQLLQTALTQINAIDSLETAPEQIKVIVDGLKTEALKLLAKAIEGLRTEVKGYAEALKNAFSITAYSYLPASMSPSYTANLVATAPSYDFTTSTNISAITYGGFGEQWHMVLENIGYTDYLYTAFNSANAVFGTVIDYLADETTAELDKTFTKEGFTVSLSYANDVLTVSVSYTSKSGAFAPSMLMTYNKTTGESLFKVIATSTNQFKLVVTENTYEFGAKFGATIGNVSALLTIEKKEDNTTEGHINQFVSYTSGGETKDIKFGADFYADADYVSVVGNKADGMTLATGYINELYSATTGKLLGYKVMETTAGVTYNTLWFNLNDIGGITSVKVTDKTDANTSSKSTCDVYLNGSETLFNPTYNKKIIKTSRKYDIELRTIYYYGLDEEGKVVEYKTELPMMFIQDGDNYNSFVSDMATDNGITASVNIDANALAQIRSDYDTLIPTFITNKDASSSADVDAFLN